MCCCGSFVSFQFTLFTLFTAQREVPLIVHPPRCLTPPSSSFVCSGLLISSSSSPPSMSSRKHTLFPCHLVGARVTAPLCPERPCFLPWLSGTSSLTVCELRTSRCSSWIWKRQRNQRPNCQNPLDHRKSQREFHKNIYFCFIGYTKAFDLEPIIQTEVSQEEKPQYSILMHIYRI